MNRYQKIAWFNLIVTATAIVVTTSVVAVEIHVRGYSTIGPFFIGILVLLKASPYLFKQPQNPGAVVSDERDEFIVKRAASYAWAAFWWVFVGGCLLLWFIIGPENSLPTIALPLMALAGGLFHKTACSVAILIQYAREGGTGEGTESQRHALEPAVWKGETQ